MYRSYFLLIALTIFLTSKAVDYTITSPNGELRMELHINGGSTYELFNGTKQLLGTSKLGLTLDDGTIIGNGTIKVANVKSVNGFVDVLIGKNDQIVESYNELLVEYNENYSLIVRAYNEGVAYRFVTELPGKVTVQSETAEFNFLENVKVFFPECDTNTSEETGDGGVKYKIHQGYRNFERIYNVYNAVAAVQTNRFSVTPVLFSLSDNYKLVITEADTYDYPGMYMERTAASQIRSMKGKWACYPKSVMDPDNMYSNHLVYEREDYLAITDGTRSYPWRVMICSKDDKDLLNNELVYLLAQPCKIEDTSWIEPGKTAWEWWHKAMLEGVDFPVGNNNLSIQMYKYYIDWASANGIEYMTFDAGYNENWILELCTYAKSKNVKIIVWTWASCVRQYSGDWIRRMKAWGVAGVKIDFFERNDQEAINWGWDFAERLAKSKMIALFHGCPVPTGMSRTYPNILNYEAVRGAEDNFWRSIVTPDYHVQFPFIRALAGPYDYTPGSLRNTTKEAFYPIDVDNTVPMSMGTRAHEMAMYVIYDQWLAYLCDSPTEYDKFPEIMEFLKTVPATWNKTVPLDAKLGEYILIAKQKGDDWYVGGMTSWTSRNIEVDFSFLPAGKEYEAYVIKDHSLSSTQPKICVTETIIVTKDSRINMSMAVGGGFVLRLTDKSASSLKNTIKDSKISMYIDKSLKQLNVISKENVKRIQVYSLTGSCLLDVTCNSFTPSVDVSNMIRGSYVLRLTGDVAQTSIKFLI